eukprot:CAMPEP_0180120936 /NCGR_PEP_ID=MMETSP0986-20121125/2788_1 /TAXON_ID=697907 /ORGANISM="non described non described, Strain CCMP2293" /LENGTH=114 /DNA_ID=CAMNT_0022060051 /DNA_START=820 /DNA_END=1161 /DNA_ORIENTATION=+
MREERSFREQCTRLQRHQLRLGIGEAFFHHAHLVKDRLGRRSYFEELLMPSEVVVVAHLSARPPRHLPRRRHPSELAGSSKEARNDEAVLAESVEARAVFARLLRPLHLHLLVD